MKKIIIYQRFFEASDCWRQQVRQQNTGVQVHSTGANNPWLRRYVQPDDGFLGVNLNRNSHNRPGVSVCASAYIGRQSDGTVAVYQALPWDCRCWLSGSGPRGNANRLGYAGFEICEDGKTDEGYFLDAVMEKSVLLTAHLCALFGVDEKSVRDHSELHRMGLASNHGDISHWLKRFNRNMDDYRAAVRDALQEGVEGVYIQGGAIKQEEKKMKLSIGAAGESVKRLQTLLNQAGCPCGAADGIFGKKTQAAVKKYQAEHGLKVDGTVLDDTWNTLNEGKKALVSVSRDALSQALSAAECAAQKIQEAMGGEAWKT